MMLFRPVRQDDLDDIIRLASRAGVGMTSLPNDPARLAARIQRSVETFAGKLPRGQQGFLFVLEDTRLARVVGVSAIEVAVGLDEPFYNFRLQRTVRASKELGVYKNQELLNLSYDHTGHSELCTLFLDPEYQKNRNGLFCRRRASCLSPPSESCFHRICLLNCAGVAMSRAIPPSGTRWAITFSTFRLPMPTG